MTAEELYGRCWDVLVEHAGAEKGVRAHAHFIWVCTETREESSLEFRFCGVLGFGGKFRRYDGKLYVDCYPEDVTRKRTKVIQKVNQLLAQLQAAV